jgi:hypothetical protein
MKLKCYDIQWDKDNEKIKLPKQVVLNIENIDKEELSNIISDKYGWLIYSLKYKILN